MTETTPFTIGADVCCSDGACGKVSRVVVDPVARTVTHLVVEPGHWWHAPGRLVPLGLADATADQIRLRCTLADFGKLDPAEETQFLPGTPGYPGYDPEQVLWMPYYSMGMGMGGGMAGNYGPQTVTYDTVPLDEVEVRRGEHVHATDGHIGKVQGLVIDPKPRSTAVILGGAWAHWLTGNDLDCFQGVVFLPLTCPAACPGPGIGVWGWWGGRWGRGGAVTGSGLVRPRRRAARWRLETGSSIRSGGARLRAGAG